MAVFISTLRKMWLRCIVVSTSRRVFFVKQKTAYEMRISDWSSDVCSSDLVCELLGAGVAKPLLGKASVPDDLPYVTGSIGLLGTEPSYWMMNRCDTLLMIGTTFPYAEFLPQDGQEGTVQKIGRASCRERVRQYV